jgi:hypothetical protein
MRNIFIALFCLISLNFLSAQEIEDVNWIKPGFIKDQRQVSVSDDDKYVAFTSGNFRIKIFDLETNKFVKMISNDNWFDIFNLEFSDNSNNLMCIIKEGKEYRLIWLNFFTNEIIKSFVITETNYLVDFIISQNKKHCICINKSSNNIATVNVWDIENEEKLYDFQIENYDIIDKLNFSNNSQYIVYKYGWDIFFIDLLSGKQSHVLSFGNLSRYSIYSPEIGNMLVLANSDHIKAYYYTFDSSTPELLWEANIQQYGMLFFANKFNKILVETKDSIKILNSLSGVVINTFEKESYNYNYKFFEKDQTEFLVTATMKPEIKKLDSYETTHQFNYHYGESSVQITDDNNYALSYSKNDGTKICDLKTGEYLNTIDGEAILVPHQNKYYFIEDSLNLKFVDLFSEEMTDEITLPHKTGIIIMDDSLTHTQCLPSSHGSTPIVFYNLKTESITKTTDIYIGRALLSKSNEYILGYETESQMYSVRKFPDMSLVLEHNTEDVYRRVFSVDGKYVFFIIKELGIEMFDLETKELLRTFVNHDINGYYPYEMIPIEGNKYFFENTRSEIRIWDIEKNEVVKEFNQWEAEIVSYKVSNDSKYLLVSYSDGSIICYHLNLDLLSAKHEKKELFGDVFPNPATSQITFSLGEEFISNPVIGIIDYLGNAIILDYEINGLEIIINTSSLSPGVYFLRVRSGEKVEVSKFVVL